MDDSEKKSFVKSIKLNEFGYLVKKYYIKEFIDYNGNISKIYIDKYNFLTRNGLLLDEWVDDFTLKVVDNKYCIFSINCQKKFGVFNKNGDLVIHPIYDEIVYDKNDVFIAKSDNKYGFVIPNVQLTPIIFKEVKPCSEYVAAVKYERSWGYISRFVRLDNPNENIEYQIEPQYESADNFVNGEANVVLNGEQLTIDRNNNIIKKKIKTKHQ